MTVSKKIYSVSRLTREIKSLLEEAYAFIWITGEVSNLGRPASGHLYFTLKDDQCTIASVVFRGQAAHMNFRLENGHHVTGFGRVNVYEPRGTYQVIFEYLEPAGVGALHLQFEQLKKQLEAEGLFHPETKKTIPFLPAKIGIVTSPSGAVIRDILTVLKNRYPTIPVEIYPVRVQGRDADLEIAQGLRVFNQRADADVIIIARGGGSLEDFQPFNSEITARAIHASAIPVISAVGHETDYTIADFTADLRAPTPSVAGERVVPEKAALHRLIKDTETRIIQAMQGYLADRRVTLNHLRKQIKDPRRKIDDAHLRFDDLKQRLIRAYGHILTSKKNRLGFATDKLHMKRPSRTIQTQRERLSYLNDRLVKSGADLVMKNRTHYQTLCEKLALLSPIAVLERGYSITRALPGETIVTDAAQVTAGQDLEITVARGKIISRVKGTR